MATLTLRPNGAGAAQGWDAEGGDWQKVDESSGDGDTTRLYSPTANAVATFAHEDHTTQEGVINSVTVYISTRGLDPISNVVQLAVRVSGTNYFSADKTYNNTSYHDESNTWSTNPNTSAAWTWAEVDALEAGMKRISGGGQAVTQVWIVVDYTPATWEQEGFRFYNDDGDEDASTAHAAQDTNVTVPEATIKRLRLLLNATGTPDPRKFILYYKKSTDGTYIKVPTSGTSEAFTIVASSHITASGENTTARLTAPSGKSTSDFDAGRIQDDENPADSVTVSADDYTEMEWTLNANAAAVDGGVYQFRVYKYLETFATELTTGGTASALGENSPNETAAKAFDDDSGTKWLHFTGSATWLKYDLGSGVTKLVTKYALTSANDDDTRDPKDWELQGSNDNSAWTTVDTITGETFASRGLRKEYTCDTPGTTAYRYWRLYINANNGNGSITQLAEVQLYQLSDPSALDTYTLTPEWTIGSGGTEYTSTLTEVVTLVDTLNKAESRTLTETVTVVDTVVKAMSRTLTEVATLVDTVVKQTSRTFTEVATVVDTLTKLTSKTLSESVTIVDTIVRALSRTFTETATLVDTVVKATSRTLSESVTLVDTVVKHTARTLSEAVTLVDSVVKSLSKTLSETVTLVDTMLKSVSRTLSEAVTLVDTVVKQTARELSESVTVTDTITRAIEKTLTETVTLVDSIVRSISRTFTESVSLVDTLTSEISSRMKKGVTILLTKAKQGIAIITNSRRVVLGTRKKDKNVIQ